MSRNPAPAVPIVEYRGHRIVPGNKPGRYYVTFLWAQRTRYGTLAQCMADVDARESMQPFPDQAPAFA